MKKITLQNFALSIILSGLLIGCASTSGLTDALNAIGTAANAAGYSDIANVVNVASATSKAMEDISPEEEYYIGRAVSATLFESYPTDDISKQELYLNEICSVLVLHSDKPELYNGYHVKIIDSNEVNAFSTSAGHILVFRGLINCAESEDALAAVIAHEIAHIQLQHGLKAIKASRWSSVAQQGASAAVTIMKGDDSEMASTLNSMVDDVLTNMVKNGYSQTQEYQADELALKLMNDAGYNVKGMDDMLSLIKKYQNGQSTGMYKTHPSAESRITKVDALTSKMTKTEDTQKFRVARFTKAMN